MDTNDLDYGISSNVKPQIIDEQVKLNEQVKPNEQVKLNEVVNDKQSNNHLLNPFW